MTKKELGPTLAIVAVGLLWGTYWIPLRGLAAMGLGGPWATIAPLVLATLVLAVGLIWRWRRFVNGGLALVGVGLFGGTAFLLYSNALLLTEVVTAILLFYLTPVWSTVLARLVLGQPITTTRDASACC